jgi:hypothetical protein
MKNVALLTLFPALVLEACHPNSQLKPPNEQKIRAVELAHAKENAEQDKRATEEQLKVMRSYAARGNSEATNESNTVSLKGSQH